MARTNHNPDCNTALLPALAPEKDDIMKDVHSPRSTVHGQCSQFVPSRSSQLAARDSAGTYCGLWTVDRGLSLLLLFCCTIFLPGCDNDDEFPDTYRQDVITYFQHVALGFEFGDAAEVTRKWDTDMKLFVGGTPDQALRSELDRIIGEINELTEADGFDIAITTDTLACNAYIYFGTKEKFAKIYPDAAKDLPANLGLFYVKFDGTGHIFTTTVFVDLVRTTDIAVRKHLLREELTQSLGLARDSYEYPLSIFQQAWTTVTEYAEMDRDLIRLLYNPGMPTGLDEEAVKPVLEALTLELQIGRP
jgi:hypothetical protein